MMRLVKIICALVGLGYVAIAALAIAGRIP